MTRHALQMVIYISHSRIGAADQDNDMQSLVQTAQMRNATLGLTGVLLLRGSIFFQYLEGRADNVNAVLQSIKDDPRHDGMYVLMNEPCDTRKFDDWSMEAFHDPDDTDGILEALEALCRSFHAAGAFNESAMSAHIKRLIRDMVEHRIETKAHEMTPYPFSPTLLSFDKGRSGRTAKRAQQSETTRHRAETRSQTGKGAKAH